VELNDLLAVARSGGHADETKVACRSLRRSTRRRAELARNDPLTADLRVIGQPGSKLFTHAAFIQIDRSLGSEIERGLDDGSFREVWERLREIQRITCTSLFVWIG